MLEIELKSQLVAVVVVVGVFGRQKVVIVLGGVVGWDVVKNASLCLQQYRVVGVDALWWSVEIEAPGMMVHYRLMEGR